MLPSPSSIKNNQKVGIPLKHPEITLDVIVGHCPIVTNVKIALERGMRKASDEASLPRAEEEWENLLDVY